MNLYNLSVELDSAQVLLKEYLYKAEQLLKESNEHKSVQSLTKQIKEEFNKLESESPLLSKKALTDFGFECRTGYKIELNLDLPEYHSIEDFSFTIVHKSLHKFKLGQFTGNDYGGFSVTFEECMESEDYMFLDHWTYFVLGKGSNEEDKELIKEFYFFSNSLQPFSQSILRLYLQRYSGSGWSESYNQILIPDYLALVEYIREKLEEVLES